MNKKVVIGLSGGVDSAVSAFLLKESGYEVEAIFMYNWDDYINSYDLIENTRSLYSCSQNDDWKMARSVAKHLKIPITRVSFVDDYWNNVFIDFLNKIKSGLTPNPDVVCNLFIKFGSLAEYINIKFPNYFLATGHYAKIIKKNERFWLSKPKDIGKDQTYFLCLINYKILKKVLFPLNDLNKTEVRNIAKKINLPNYNRKDSTGICFIGERNFSAFLDNYIPISEGKIFKLDSNLNLNLVGKHSGIHKFTIGQRRNLGLKNQFGPNYVVAKQKNNNSIYVCEENFFTNKFIYSSWCLIDNINWLFDLNDNVIDLLQKKTFSAKFRYRQKNVLLQEMIFLDSNKRKAKLVLSEKQKYITNGQYAVIYKDNICIGGGIIISNEATEYFSFFLK